MQEIIEWFTAKLPDDWFTGHPSVTVDRDEIVVVGDLEDATDPGRFRADTRGERMAIAERAEDLFGRKVAWGVRQQGTTLLFTHLALPVMTRLRQRERMVLDTLVAAGVARSRADALAWCVRLVDANEEAWLTRLTEALADVDAARRSGPDSVDPDRP